MDNPTLIEPAPANPRTASKPPLFLFHDGSGTIFSYFLLSPFNRAVYGVTNARFDSGEPWKGGIAEMAVEYVKFIRKVVKTGKILLGGWSLGGILSLEIARVIAESNDGLVVAGIIMMDSVYPHAGKTGSKAPALRYQMEFESHVKPEIQASVRRAMTESKQLVSSWYPPDWKSLKGSAAPKQPPPTVFLRAKQPVAVIGEPEGTICDIDTHRHERKLGWENYEYDFIKNVLDIDGHHYDIFEDDNLDSVDQKIHMACRILDGDF